MKKNNPLKTRRVTLDTATKMFDAGFIIMIFKSWREMQTIDKSRVMQFVNSFINAGEHYSFTDFLIFGCRVELTLETEFNVYEKDFTAFNSSIPALQYSDINEMVRDGFKFATENIDNLKNIISAQQRARKSSSDDCIGDFAAMSLSI